VTELERKPFICVFNEVDRDKLLLAGFRILNDDKRNGFYIFYSEPSLEYVLADMEYIPTDRLTF